LLKLKPRVPLVRSAKDRLGQHQAPLLPVVRSTGGGQQREPLRSGMDVGCKENLNPLCQQSQTVSDITSPGLFRPKAWQADC